jgi:excisionase family DNA binding protein
MTDKIDAGGAEPLWDVKDVARFLGASTSWVYKAAERSTLPAVRIGAMLRFEPKAIRDFVTTLANRGER